MYPSYGGGGGGEGEGYEWVTQDTDHWSSVAGFVDISI